MKNKEDEKLLKEAEENAKKESPTEEMNRRFQWQKGDIKWEEKKDSRKP